MAQEHGAQQSGRITVMRPRRTGRRWRLLMFTEGETFRKRKENARIEHDLDTGENAFHTFGSISFVRKAFACAILAIEHFERTGHVMDPEEIERIMKSSG